jgi:hypothetical protein
MWMIDEGPSPGVEDAENADEPPDIMGVPGERDERLGRGAEQHVVQVFLVAADQLPQFLGQGEDDRKGGDWQAFQPLPLALLAALHGGLSTTFFVPCAQPRRIREHLLLVVLRKNSMLVALDSSSPSGDNSRG